MSWVRNAEPTVQRQRGRWVLRVSGYDPATGRRRVQQLGTFSTKKAATAYLRDVQSGRAGGEDEVPPQRTKRRILKNGSTMRRRASMTTQHRSG